MSVQTQGVSVATNHCANQLCTTAVQHVSAQIGHYQQFKTMEGSTPYLQISSRKLCRRQENCVLLGHYAAGSGTEIPRPTSDPANEF